MNVEKVEFSDRFSIARLAILFGMSRATVAKRIQMHGVRAEGKRDGHPVYRMRDVAPALVESLSRQPEVDENDPMRMNPLDRKNWFLSERARLQVETEKRSLIPAAQVEAEMAAVCKRVVQWIDTLPDQLERDAALTPAQVDAVHASANRMRGALYESIVSAEPVGTQDAEAG